MKCPTFEQLNLYIDGELNEKENIELMSHLKRCSECMSYVTQSMEEEQTIRMHLLGVYSNKSVANNVLKKIKTIDIEVGTPKVNYKRFFALGFAAIVLILIIFLVKPSLHHGNIAYTGVSASKNFVDNNEIKNNMDYFTNAGNYHQYSGEFSFKIKHEKQLSIVKFVGSATLKFDINNNMIAKDFKGFVSMVSGKNVKFGLSDGILHELSKSPFGYKKIKLHSEPNENHFPLCASSSSALTNVKVASETEYSGVASISETASVVIVASSPVDSSVDVIDEATSEIMIENNSSDSYIDHMKNPFVDTSVTLSGEAK